MPEPDFNFRGNEIIIINVIHKREKKKMGHTGFKPTTSGAWRTDGRTLVNCMDLTNYYVEVRKNWISKWFEHSSLPIEYQPGIAREYGFVCRSRKCPNARPEIAPEATNTSAAGVCMTKKQIKKIRFIVLLVIIRNITFLSICISMFFTNNARKWC